MNPHQRCLKAKVKYRNEPKQVMPKSEDPSRSLEINAIWTFDTEFPTTFNKSCTYITFKSAVKHRQLGYGYPTYVYNHVQLLNCIMNMYAYTREYIRVYTQTHVQTEIYII